MNALACLTAVVLGWTACAAQAPGGDRTLRPQQAPTAPAQAEARVALVIGNSGYADAPLTNPVHDAQAMKAALEACGFQVSLLEDAGKRAMEDAMRAFGARLHPGTVGLFYFAGHGLQAKGANFLVPVGARLQTEVDVAYECVDVGQVLDRMEEAKNGLNVLILDACRNNPFARSWRALGGGLAQVNAPTGSLIAYATAPGRTAADGTGEHGTYTTALLKQLREPGLKLEEVFKRVRQEVKQASADVQVPWESNSTVGDFYFTAPAPPPAPAPVIAPAPPPAPVVAAGSRWKEGMSEAALWEAVKASPDAEALIQRIKRGDMGTPGKWPRF